MKYTVDEIINDVVTIINTETEEKKYVDLSNMPDGIKENDVLVFENNTYRKDVDEEELRRQRIQDKMNMLRKSD